MDEHEAERGGDRDRAVMVLLAVVLLAGLGAAGVVLTGFAWV